LLDTPPTVATSVAELFAKPNGAATTTLVALQLVGATELPLRVTVLELWLDPKFAPDMVTKSSAPYVTDKLVIVGMVEVPLAPELIVANVEGLL